MLRPPDLVSVTLKDARPSTFFFRNERYTVEKGYGPWIADGGWWTEQQWIFKQWDMVASAE